MTILNLWAYIHYYSRFFLLSDDHYASISDERSVVDAYDDIFSFYYHACGKENFDVRN